MIAVTVDLSTRSVIGLCPTYWAAKLYWELDGGGPYVWRVFLVGVVYLALLTAWLLRRFDREMHR